MPPCRGVCPGNVLPWVAQTVVVWVLMRFCAMNLINIQTTTVSVQLRYINAITRHTVRPGNVLPWVAQTVVVWVLMRFCAMNLINIQNNCFSTAALYKSNRAPPCPPRECASLGWPNSCRLVLRFCAMNSLTSKPKLFQYSYAI